MMSREEALDFAKASAAEALDQVYAFSSIEESSASYRENVRTTLQDERADQYEVDAFALFDSIISETALR